MSRFFRQSTRPAASRRTVPAVLLAAAGALATPFAAAELAGLDAPSGSYRNDAGHTRFLWRIEHLGLSNYTARINDVDIELEFDADDVTASSIKAVLDPRSVDTGYVGAEDFDAKISDNEKILNASKYPTIEFESSRITLTGPDSMAVDGALTLLGVTRPVTLDVTFSGSIAAHPFAKVPALGFAATAVVERKEFGLDFLAGSGLGDQIEIEIHAEFLRQ